MIATNNGVKYIQLDIGFFDNKKIKAIRSMPSGSDILVIWIELLVLAGQINDCGSIYFSHEVPYTTDLLSAQFDYPPTTIQLALTTFIKFGMIEIIDDIIKISNWQRYQNEEALERIRLAHNARQRAYYQRQKALKIEGECVSTDVSNDIISDESCSYISLYNNSSISKEDNEDKDKGCGEKGKKPKRERKAFVKPTVEEVAAYCKERSNGIDPEAFYDHFESIGWVDKHGNPMKDWKATIRTWERWRKEHPQFGVPQRKDNAKSHYKPDGSYDYEAGQSKELESF